MSRRAKDSRLDGYSEANYEDFLENAGSLLRLENLKE